MGHSFCTCLKADLTAEIDARMAPTFNIAGTVDEVLFLGKGGKCINELEQIDFHWMWSDCPDIIILMIGDNNVFCETTMQFLTQVVRA